MGADPVTTFTDEELGKSAESLYSSPIEVGKDHLTILHLSDLHFCSSKQFRFRPVSVDSNLQKPTLSEAISSALAKEDMRPDAVVLSGDFGNRTPHLDLEHHARKELQDLQSRLAVPFERWVVVPGNHDMDWDAEKYSSESKASVIAKYLEKTRNYFHYVYKLVHAEKKCTLAARLKTWERDNESEWEHDPIRHYLPSYASFQLSSGKVIELHGYNSCLVEGADWPGIGFVGKGQPKLFECISAQNKKTPPVVKIAVLHHHVKEVSKVLVLAGESVRDRMGFSLIADARWLLDCLIQKGYAMLLHGHQHQPFISQEILSCFGTDHRGDRWYRDYIHQRLIIFGAGSASFQADQDPEPNSFFVYRIDGSEKLEAWNFSVAGDLHSGFGVHHSCTQSLRNRLSPEFVQSHLQKLLESIEQTRPGGDPIELLEECDPAERILGFGLRELLTAVGTLRRKKEAFLLNLPEKNDNDDKNLGYSNNLPARFAKLLRMAVKYKVPLFSDDWLPTGSLTEPHAFNLIRWASLNLARELQEAGGSPDKRLESLPFGLAVLSEYPEDLRIPEELVEKRYAIVCAIVRRGTDTKPELLLRDHEEWKAMVLPVTEIDESLWTNYNGIKWKRQIELKILHPWFRSSVSFDIRQKRPDGVVRKMQVSPSKGVWTNYHFNICFLSLDSGGRAQLDRLTAPNTPSVHGLSFVPISKIQGALAHTKEDFTTKPDLLDDSLTRAAVMNRALMERLVAALENPEPGCFYDGK